MKLVEKGWFFMKCPKCKKCELKENVRYKRKGFFKNKAYKILTYFCPLCDFEKEKELEISGGEFVAGSIFGVGTDKSSGEAETEVEIGKIRIKAKGKKEE